MHRPPFPWARPLPGFHWPKPEQPWALPPLPTHKLPPFNWPKPEKPWPLPPLPSHKFPPFNWPKPGKPWALPPLPAHRIPPSTWPQPRFPWTHRFPPFTWPKPRFPWALPPLPAFNCPPLPWTPPAQQKTAKTSNVADSNKCWRTLNEMNGCIHDIVSSLHYDKSKVNPTCCKTFTKTKSDCSFEASEIL
ncbi:hypothetical protein U1Q18_006634, partial [Sarracenia purpurea var. burkii]